MVGARYTKSVVFVLGGNDDGTLALQGTGFVAGIPTAEEDIVIPAYLGLR